MPRDPSPARARCENGRYRDRVILGVVIPVFNERELLPIVLARLDATPPPIGPGGAPLRRVLVLVDDGSTDGVGDTLRACAKRGDVLVERHHTNRGKGAAVRTGIDAALRAGAGVILIHDADLEYDPADHAAVLAPILRDEAHAVIGSRFRGRSRDGMYARHALGNAIITLVSNEFSGLALSDIECCFKAFTSAVAHRLDLHEQRFGVEPEIIAKLARMGGVRIAEVPVSYRGRTFADGKKISWRDGFAALACIVKYSLR